LSTQVKKERRKILAEIAMQEDYSNELGNRYHCKMVKMNEGLNAAKGLL